jgi:hypothetical protein
MMFFLAELLLTAQVVPDDASEKTIYWGSANESIATVEDGIVTAVSKGITSIIVSSKENARFAICKCTVTAEGTDKYIILQSDGIMVQKNDLSASADWNTAKSLCENSSIGGFSDWRLPSIGELVSLYNQRNTIGGFSTSPYGSEYWSSSFDFDYGMYYGFDFYYGGYPFVSVPNQTYNVRAVRNL